MRKVLMTQAMTENGISRFDGLYDENGFPVTAELEKNEDGVVFTLLHKELTEAEKQAVCDEYDDSAGRRPAPHLCGAHARLPDE